jgi:hypothetical protein
MKLTLFNNKKGLIHGADPKRIGCDVSGVLKIGKAEIKITAGEDSIMPMLFQGSTGNYPATFTAAGGEIYTIEKVAVRAGWIQPPHPMTVEVMELRCRADLAEERLEKLEGMFDTNSLNFLIY